MKSWQAKVELEHLLGTITELKRRAAELEEEIEYPSVGTRTVSTTVPDWVREMVQDRLWCGNEPISVSDSFRTVLYYAIKNPELIENVSLKDLRAIKRKEQRA
jgi:hypothetical protein